MNGLNGFKQCDSLLYAEHNELSDNNYSTIYDNYECIESVQHNQHNQHNHSQHSQHLAFDWVDNKDQQFNSLNTNFFQTNNCLNLLDTNQLISEQSIQNFALNDNCVDDNSVLDVHNNNNKHLNKIRGTTKKSSRKETNSSRQTKPVSAYALFFRDAQSVIKSSNPNASFGEISKVVASNWETLDKSSKNIYKQRADQEKKNYLKSLASSRAKQIAGLMDQSSKQYAALPKDSNQTDANSNNESDFSASNFGQQMLQQHQQSSNSINIANVNPNASGECGAVVAQNLDANKQTCIRDGCSNDAIDSSEWDSEYCSSECCVKHCSDVFQAWVEKQQLSQTNNT